MELYDPLSHDYQGTSSIGKHRSCVLCGGGEEQHKAINDKCSRLSLIEIPRENKRKK